MNQKPDHDTRFPSTYWSMVLTAADTDSLASAAALARLCQDYWYPLHVFVRRSGYTHHEAQGLTQEFLARLLERNVLKAAVPARGKLRHFLLRSLEHFLRNKRDRSQGQGYGSRALRDPRDGTMAQSWHAWRPANDFALEQVFDRRWALTLLEKVHAQLKSESVAQGEGEQFEVLQAYLSGEPTEGSYDEAATRLGSSEWALCEAVYRLRARLDHLLRAEVARTVAHPGDVEDELAFLLATLGHSKVPGPGPGPGLGTHLRLLRRLSNRAGSIATRTTSGTAGASRFSLIDPSGQTIGCENQHRWPAFA